MAKSKSTKVIASIESRPTFRNLNGRYVKAHKALLEERRTKVRSMARRFVELAQEEAPEGETGKFKESIRWRSYTSSDSVGFTVTSKQPLGTFILKGTKAHEIWPKNAKCLHFYWPKANPPGYVCFGMVNHPGTKPNKFIGRAYKRWLPGARADLREISTAFVRELVGAGTERKVIR